MRRRRTRTTSPLRAITTFDTTPDLTGADLDISRFIRSGDERDLQVFWTDIPNDETPPSSRQPHREELCSLPFLTARHWLCGKEDKNNRKPKLVGSMRAWVWDWLDGEWVVATRDILVPGRVVCVDARCGGYTAGEGFLQDSRVPVSIVVPIDAKTDCSFLDQVADNQQDGAASLPRSLCI